jgi:hypothetical protein
MQLPFGDPIKKEVNKWYGIVFSFIYLFLPIDTGYYLLFFLNLKKFEFDDRYGKV